jgi:putative transposase
MVEGPGQYAWSSYRYNGLGKSDALVTPHELYIALGEDDEKRRAGYRSLFSHHVDGETLQSIRTTLNQELVMGTDKFKDEIERQLARRVKPGKAGRPRVDRTAY